MSLAKALTPQNTEEIKPGLFIQKKGDSYRMIKPMAWNGKVLWKEQLKTIFTLRTFFTIAIVLFLAYSYIHDIQEFKDFHNEVMDNPDAWCGELAKLRIAPTIGELDSNDLTNISIIKNLLNEN